jgi:gas vesicle protein
MANKHITPSCFLIGLGTGIALTVLFAPHSGRATRQFMRRKALAGTDMLKSKAAAGRDYIERHGTELRNRANELMGRGSEVPFEQTCATSGAAGTSRSD